MVHSPMLNARGFWVLFCLVAALQGTTTLGADNDDPAEACDNPDAAVKVDEEPIPSLQYSSDEKNNDDEQKARKAKDFELYFSAYGELHHQKDMLTDTHRMDSYYTAIMANAEVAFRDKVVMDVGTGSGILAVWAAKAGAKKVYAIEYTDMAHNARKLVEANGVADIVTVIQGTVEGIKLPLKEDGFGDGENEKVVDVIISEWMGYMLIRESMLDSVLVARDRYLRKDTGLMFPSHGTILVAPIGDESTRHEKKDDYENALNEWDDFVHSTKENYGMVDYSILTDDYEKEQYAYYIQQSEWRELEKHTVASTPHVLKTLDFITCTHQDTRGIFDSSNNTEESVQKGNVDTNEFDFVLSTSFGAISGLASWFTTDFKSRTDDMASEDAPKLTTSVTLNTGPEQGYTHWGQQAFYFQDPIRARIDLRQTSGSLPDGGVSGKTTTIHLTGKLDMFRMRDNTRLYKIRIEHSLDEIANESQEVVRSTKPTESLFSMM
eukprot:CAMPEP_0197178718 /NCGR_PEP_ID=MMETSP1423-20130617/3921_1 /TAXON_ID=476441 /ORGANISM="Pseudo-nitzschia heimii, Strain UNC1101" /LENGTH=492 /DNA_ID=CAMNT_0042628521 /DNA_START=65 /DNA_END=1543 /DNA_ORIENTATION=-